MVSEIALAAVLIIALVGFPAVMALAALDAARQSDATRRMLDAWEADLKKRRRP